MPQPLPPYHHTWCVMILPYMEQLPLYQSVNLRLPIWGQAVVGTMLPALRCPSDPHFPTTADTDGIAVTNYPGSEGYHWWSTAQLTPSPPWTTFGDPFESACDRSGIFAVTKTNKIANITDGTSQTIIIAERNSAGYGGGASLTCGTGVPRNMTNGYFCARLSERTSPATEETKMHSIRPTPTVHRIRPAHGLTRPVARPSARSRPPTSPIMDQTRTGLAHQACTRAASK